MTHGLVATARSRWISTGAVLSVLAALLPVTIVAVAPPAAAATNTVTLNLVNARTVGNVTEGDPIAAGKKFTWIITADDTGDPTQAVADCVPSAANPDPLRDTSGDAP